VFFPSGIYFCCILNIWQPRWASSVHSRTWAGRSRFRIPAGARNFHFFPKRSGRVWGPPILLFGGYRSSFAGIKRPGREFSHISPYSVQVKNECGCTSAPPIRIIGVDGHGFCTFAPPPQSVRNGFIQNRNRKDCLRAVAIHYFIIASFRRNGVSVSNRTAVKIQWGKFGIFNWFPVKLMTLISSPYLLKMTPRAPAR